MYLRRTVRKATWLHSVPLWHRGHFRQDTSHRIYEAAYQPEDVAEADRVHGITQSLHLSTRRMRHAIFQATQKVGQLHLD